MISKIKYIFGKFCLCLPIIKYKQFVYNLLGVNFLSDTCSPKVKSFIGNPIVIGSYSNILMHDDTSIERGSFIVANDRVEIRTGAAIAYGVAILTSADPRTKLRKLYPKMTAPVIIGDYCWIGARSTILPGVTIGECSVVAAGSVVTKDVPPYSLVAGVPAVVKRNLEI